MMKPVASKKTKLFHSLKNGSGSVLIGVIIAIVIIAALGGALVTMTSTSTVSQFGAMDSFRAYYLAESGGRYAIPIIKKNISTPAALITMLNGKTFQFANGDRFRLTLSYTDPVYTLQSFGILAQGARELNATRKITYRINSSGGSSDNPFDTPEDLADNWTDFDDKKVKIVDSKKTDDSPALDMPGKEASIKLKWSGNTGLPNLAAAWATNGGLLSYGIQIKVKIENAAKEEYMTGLSFRVGSDSMYGFSFLKRTDCNQALPSDAFCSQIPGTDNNLYLVLWKKVGGTYSVIDYRKATSSDNVLETVVENIGKKEEVSYYLADWSTLVVKIEEEYVLDGSGSRVDLNGDGFDDRRNLISCYVQGTTGSNPYPRDTIDWDYARYREVGWKSGASNPIIDASLTTENFATLLPNEIGLHNYFHDAGASKTFLDDFSMQIEGSGGGGDKVEQY